MPYLIRINRSTMSDAARTYLETHDWDDIMGTLTEGIALAKELHTDITLENWANQPTILINADGTHRRLG